jgi:hypothetical protein
VTSTRMRSGALMTTSPSTPAAMRHRRVDSAAATGPSCCSAMASRRTASGSGGPFAAAMGGASRIPSSCIPSAETSTATAGPAG